MTRDELPFRDDPLSADLDRVVEQLREPVRPRAAWRAQLAARIEALDGPDAVASRRSGRAWPMAAALLVSAGAAAWLMRAATIGQPDASSRVVRFAVAAPDARRVSLVGDFDGWNPNAVPMRRGADGHTWIVDVQLAPGRHVFAYSIDGALRVDPAAPRAIEDDFGSPSSVVVVSEQGGD